MIDTAIDLRTRILNAALPHVPFEGWSESLLRHAAVDLNVDVTSVRQAYPDGALGLAIAHHKQGDEAMRARLEAIDISGMRIRDRVTIAIKSRLDVIKNKEVARRSTTFFSLPNNGLQGVQLIWDTSDSIWSILGDRSNDINWYTKRAILSGVYSSTLLYWLGDESPEYVETWGFLDRRITNVMQFEGVKARFRNSPVLSRLIAGPSWMMRHVKPPRKVDLTDLPGTWKDPM